jgi:GT2 family glycosyltransferase
LDHNAGFAEANNMGIASTSTKYVALLNNDTQVDARWLAALIDAAEGDARIGSCAAQVVLDARPDTIDSAGIYVDRLGFAWQRGHARPAVEYTAACDVLGASGAAALYRREMLDQIGMFDAEFESYYEDVDLAWRAQRAGWRCRYAPQARVRHVHSATGGRDPARKHRLLTRNRWWTLVKNMPAPRLALMLPLIVLADTASLARGLWRTRSAMPLKARVEALRGLRRMWRKRGTLR